MDTEQELLDEIEILVAQLDSWRTLASNYYDELQTVKQELKATNLELFEVCKFQKKSLAEVIEMSQKILATEKSASECLTELLNTMYGM